MNDGVMLDSDVIAGLEWLASTQENKQHFYQRLAKAQQFYIATTQKAANFGKQFDQNGMVPTWLLVISHKQNRLSIIEGLTKLLMLQI